MKDDGWFKLYRQLKNNPIVMKDGDHLAVWALILLSAVYEPEDVDFNGERITLKAGQFTTGRKELSRLLKINESKIDRILKRFENEHQIEQVMSSRCRLITVKNWGAYQKSEHQIEQQVSTNKEIKNTERNKNTKPIASSNVAEVKIEKKKREPSPHFVLIEYFFSLKGWVMDYAIAKRYLRAGKDLLEACKGDVEKGKEKLKAVKDWAYSKNLEWSIETAIKRFHDLAEVKKPNPKAQEYRDWYFKEYGVEPIN